jgi:ubiquinone/menaquinone biosynthesis C-methylase UbiE
VNPPLPIVVPRRKARKFEEIWYWLDLHLGRGSYTWLRRWLYPTQEAPIWTYARLLGSHLGPNTLWLDAGCGHCVLQARSEQPEQELVDRVRLAVGCDVDVSALRNHRSVPNRVCCQLDQLPFADESFDVVSLSFVVEHLADPQAVFTEIARIIAPNGLLIVHTPNAASYYVTLIRLGRWIFPESVVYWCIKFLESREPDDVFPTHYRANTSEKLHNLLETAGMRETLCLHLMDRPLCYFCAPLSAVELLLGRVFTKLGWRRAVASTILAVYAKCPILAAPNMANGVSPRRA